jgi:hypothetical protein
VEERSLRVSFGRLETVHAIHLLVESEGIGEVSQERDGSINKSLRDQVTGDRSVFAVRDQALTELQHGGEVQEDF